MMVYTGPYTNGQTVIPVAEAPTMPCPTCSPYHGKFDRIIVCPNCTAGRVPFVGRIAIATTCPTCEGIGKTTKPMGAMVRGMYVMDCPACNGLGYLIVASAHVDGSVPIYAVARSTPGDALFLSDVQPTTERCPTCWGSTDVTHAGAEHADVCGCGETEDSRTCPVPRCPTCTQEVRGSQEFGCDPIPVAAGEMWREWPE